MLMQYRLSVTDIRTPIAELKRLIWITEAVGIDREAVLVLYVRVARSESLSGRRWASRSRLGAGRLLMHSGDRLCPFRTENQLLSFEIRRSFVAMTG
jgi:hypothetical protein